MQSYFISRQHELSMSKVFQALESNIIRTLIELFEQEVVVQIFILESGIELTMQFKGSSIM